MTLDYEYFRPYNPDCGDEINYEGQIRDWLKNMDLMFEFVSTEKPEILDEFLRKIASKYESDLENEPHVLSDVGLDRLLKDESVLGSYENVKDLALQLIMKNIPFREGYILSEEKEPIKWFDYCRAKYMLLYHRIVSLVEILGREKGIKFFQDFVQYLGKELVKKGKISVNLKDARKAWVKGWSKCGMEFGVVDLDEHMFLCKFDRCVSHESMKHIKDKELAYYSVCYTAPKVQEHTFENVWLRRSITLFSGDFCDELRWDPNVHPDPEQPSHEFSRKIVPK
ncbi:MAG: hypothetical protein ACTSSE_05130 [Candidatus Thorarchaeota archaeon]